MRKYFGQLFTLSLLLFLGVAHANQRDLNWAQGSHSSPEQNVAIVVGVQTYDKRRSGFNPLSHTVNDANRLSNTLRQRGYGNPRTLINQQATKNFILNAIRQEAKRVRNGDGTLIFAFSGHGGSIGNDNYLATFDALSSDFKNTGLSVREVVQTIQQTGVKRAVLFLDACRNNPIYGARSNLPSFLNKNYGRGIQILYAAEQNHYSYETSELQQGVFSYFLNRGLQGQAAYGGIITFSNLASFVETSVMNWTNSKFETTQRPYRGAGSEHQGNFILARLGNHQPPPPPSYTPTPQPSRPPIQQASYTPPSPAPTQPQITADSDLTPEQLRQKYPQKFPVTPRLVLNSYRKGKTSYILRLRFFKPTDKKASHEIVSNWKRKRISLRVSELYTEDVNGQNKLDSVSISAQDNAGKTPQQLLAFYRDLLKKIDENDDFSDAVIIQACEAGSGCETYQ